MATMTTPLSPAPRYTTPLRPRFKTNPSQGVPYVRHSSSRDVARRGSRDTPKTKIMDQSAAVPVHHVHVPIVPIEPVDMIVDLPTPSSALTTDMSEFPLPPVRSVAPTTDTASSSSHATTRTPRPLPPRPGPPPVRFFPPSANPMLTMLLPARTHSRMGAGHKITYPFRRNPRFKNRILLSSRSATTTVTKSGNGTGTGRHEGLWHGCWLRWGIVVGFDRCCETGKGTPRTDTTACGKWTGANGAARGCWFRKQGERKDARTGGRLRF